MKKCKIQNTTLLGEDVGEMLSEEGERSAGRLTKRFQLEL